MTETSLPTISFENNAGRVLADPAGFLRINWGNRERTFGDTRALFTQLLQSLQYFQRGRVLINQIGMVPFTPDEQQWVSREWLPQAVHKGGYHYGAVVVSPDVFVRLATAYITSKVQGLALTYHTFNFEAEAVKRLLQQPAVGRQ